MVGELVELREVAYRRVRGLVCAELVCCDGSNGSTDAAVTTAAAATVNITAAAFAVAVAIAIVSQAGDADASEIKVIAYLAADPHIIANGISDTVSVAASASGYRWRAAYWPIREAIHPLLKSRVLETVNTIHASAHDLVDRMLAVTGN